MAQRQQRLEAERTELLARIKVQELEDEVCDLRRKAARNARQPDGEPDGSGPDSAGGQKRTRRDDEGGGQPPAKCSSSSSDLKGVNPDQYEGKTLHAFKEYVRRCETRFRLAP